MRYLGGKARQAAWIRGEILARRGDRQIYHEPFVGGGSVAATVAPHFTRVICSDVVPDLIELWKAVTSGWEPPAALSRDEYEALRTAPPSALRAWAGYAASYNGKWFAGYGPTASGRDYLAESKRAIAKKAAALREASFACTDYAYWKPGPLCVVYCDPPYADTEGYGAAGEFDHPSFWRRMDEWHDAGALVLVSEYTAPSHWHAVSSVERVETMHHGGPSSGARRETLFARSTP